MINHSIKSITPLFHLYQIKNLKDFFFNYGGSIVRKIQNELDERKKMILQSAENITANVTKNINIVLEEKFKIWEEKHNYLNEKVDNQKKRLCF